MKRFEILFGLFAVMVLFGCGRQSDTSASAGSGGSLILQAIDYRYMGRDFKLDHYMTMTTLRYYHLHGQVQATGAESGSADKIGLNSNLTAKYQYRVLLAPYDIGSGTSRDSFLSYDTGETRIKNGILDLDITFPIDMVEHPVMMAKVKFIIELKALDNGPLFSAKWAPFEPLTESGKVDFITSKQSIDDVMKSVTQESTAATAMIAFNSAQKLRLRADYSPKSLLLEKISASELTQSNLKSLRLDQADIRESLAALRASGEISKKFGSVYCDLFIAKDLEHHETTFEWVKNRLGDYEPETGPHAKCVSEPQKYLNFVPLDYVLSVDSDPISKPVSSKYFVISDGNTEERSSGHYSAMHGTRDTKFAYNDTEIGAGLFVKNNTGIRFGHEWFSFDQDFKSDTTINRSGGTWSRNFQVDELEFDFAATVTECLLITGKTGEKSQKTYQYCFDTPVSKPVVSEAWYFLYQISLTPLMNTALDRTSAGQLLFSAMIRGGYNFNGFIQNLSARLQADPLGDRFFKSINEKNNKAPETSRQLTPIYTDGNIPGVIFE